MVCRAPGENHACTALRNIKEKKLSEDEEQDAGKRWDELDEERVPPCALERGGFMRSKAFTLTRTHAYARDDSSSHGHFDVSAHRMPAYSLEATPFRWVRRDESDHYAATWGIELSQNLEDRADELMSWESAWVQDHRNQLALLDSFFSALEPRKSLVFVYAKDVPLLDEREPGARILVGAGFIDQVGPTVEWQYKGDGPLRSIMWERAVTHSIRPDFEDGFLLPYQQLLDDPALQGEDLERFVARAPSEHFDEFSYVSELVGHDGAIAALAELARVLDLLPRVVDGPWDRASTWIADRLAEAWHARGPYPGLGSTLAAAGLERGPVLAHRVLDALDDTTDMWPAIGAAIADAASGTGPAAGLVGRTARKAWEKLVADEERFQQLRVMSRFAVTVAQARRLFDRETIAPRDVVGNPYLLFELDRGPVDAVTFTTIDRGLFPRDDQARAALAADPIPEPVEEAGDDRRVRGACVHVLECAAQTGHTILDEPGLRKRLSDLRLEPACDPPTDVFELAVEEFEPTLVQRNLARDQGRGWQLDRLSASTACIRKDVQQRLEGGALPDDWDWRDAINETIGQDMPATTNARAAEESARAEKAEALRILATCRISALVGPAGTGKTTMLEALCSNAGVHAGGVILLAPTGKARVQLGDKVGARAQTLAQFLQPDRWDRESGRYLLAPGAAVERGARTVVIDEASMLTEEMLAAVIDAVADVDRLVLCGDPRQLPPIGAGRPFADLVALLRDCEEAGGGLAQLTIGRRQVPLEGANQIRDDMAVASLFSIDSVLPSADQALARVVDGKGDGTIELIKWDQEEDLHRKLVDYLCSCEELELGPRDANALTRSLGASGEHNGRPRFDWGNAGAGAERWQILSPVRSRPGGVVGLNGAVRHTWRAGDATAARRSWKLPPPLGADEVLFNDKVMCLSNHRREAWDVNTRQKHRGEVANGEIGVAVFSAGKPPKGLKVELSTQPGLQYTFWASELNGESDRGETLEVAYAVTIHKAQGSQFGMTLVVIPDPCPLLSPELLYTALTRQRERVAVFMQGDASSLRSYASPSRSETARRLTCLFRPVDPFTTPDGLVVDGAHVHRTANDELVRSKSEVIVANTLRSLGIAYGYEEPLTMPDRTSRLPDFTIRRPGHSPVFWEHLGMLDRPGYRADWEAKKRWYIQNGILPWEDGGGPAGVLVCSTENQTSAGIDAREIEKLAAEVFQAA